MNEFYKYIGTIMRDARVEKGNKAVQVAAKMGITPAAIIMYEQGNRHPSVYLLHKWCLALDLHPSYPMTAYFNYKNGKKTRKIAI